MEEDIVSKIFRDASTLFLQILENPVHLAFLIIGLTTVLIILLYLIGKKSGKRQTILLVGSSDAGKTSMFVKLTQKQNVMTFTSIKENKGKYHFSNSKDGKSVVLVDIPGHDRIRNKFINEHKDAARAIVFVIDSGNFTKQIRDAAELMYDILADKSLVKSKVPILVACNKQDLPTAKSCQVMQSQLEKELNTLRTTRAAALLATDNSDSSRNSYIGKKNKEFKFSDVAPVQVTFIECSVEGEGEESRKLQDVEKWLHAFKC